MSKGILTFNANDTIFFGDRAKFRDFAAQTIKMKSVHLGRGSMSIGSATEQVPRRIPMIDWQLSSQNRLIELQKRALSTKKAWKLGAFCEFLATAPPQRT